MILSENSKMVQSSPGRFCRQSVERVPWVKPPSCQVFIQGWVHFTQWKTENGSVPSKHLPV